MATDRIAHLMDRPLTLRQAAENVIRRYRTEGYEALAGQTEHGSYVELPELEEALGTLDRTLRAEVEAKAAGERARARGDDPETVEDIVNDTAEVLAGRAANFRVDTKINAADVDKAVDLIEDAQRLVQLCAAACESSYADARDSIQVTLGVDVESALHEAIEALGKREEAAVVSAERPTWDALKERVLKVIREHEDDLVSDLAGELVGACRLEDENNRLRGLAERLERLGATAYFREGAAFTEVMVDAQHTDLTRTTPRENRDAIFHFGPENTSEYGVDERTMDRLEAFVVELEKAAKR